MTKYQIASIGVIGFAAIILFAATTFHQQAQSSKSQQQKDEPTVVHKGQVTAEELEYTKKYKKSYSSADGHKITDDKERDFIGVYYPVGDEGSLPNAPVITPSQFLEKLSCEADTIVVGIVENKQSHLSADETFVYTAYDFQIIRIIKDNLNYPLEVNKTITVARPGGLIKIDNKQVIKFDDANYKPLQINKDYILFLKFVPEANGYIVSDSKGDFELENNSFKSLSQRSLPKQLETGSDSESLIKMIENSVSAKCIQSSTGGKQSE